MKIQVITLFPDMFTALRSGIPQRAVERELLDIALINLRDCASDKHRTVDDRPYGGGPGMVMMVEPLRRAIAAARERSVPGTKVMHLAPTGRRLDQAGLRELAARPGLILIASRYEGIDQRLLEQDIDEEWSIGDYVLSGGELPAMVLIDGIIRLLPGALGHEDSAEQDSFSAGLLDYPHYTRPEMLGEARVPEVLLSGDHAAIRRWRLKQSLGRTWRCRPELLEGRELDAEQRQLLAEFIREHEQN